MVVREDEIEVQFPAGVHDECHISFRDKGEPSPEPGGAVGALHVFFRVKQHALFERNGDDLYCEVPISFTQAALGAEIPVKTLYGTVKLKIPAGTQSHSRFRIAKQGMANLRSEKRGDLIVQAIVEVPNKLTAKQKELLKQFSEECGEAPGPLIKTIFDTVKEVFGG